MNTSEFNAVVISCDRWQELTAAVNAAGQRLPLDARRRLNRIFFNHVALYGNEGAFERMNGRTVSQLFSEFDAVQVKPITSGEVEGLRYRLFDAPPGNAS